MCYYNNRLYSDGKYPVTGRSNWLFIRIVNHLKLLVAHHDVTRWKHFPRYWPLVRGFRRSPVNSPHKGQWRGALMFSLICACINGWVNNGEAGDLRRHRAHNVVIVMCWYYTVPYIYVNIDWYTICGMQAASYGLHLCCSWVSKPSPWREFHKSDQMPITKMLYCTFEI